MQPPTTTSAPAEALLAEVEENAAAQEESLDFDPARVALFLNVFVAGPEAPRRRKSAAKQ